MEKNRLRNTLIPIDYEVDKFLSEPNDIYIISPGASEEDNHITPELIDTHIGNEYMESVSQEASCVCGKIKGNAYLGVYCANQDCLSHVRKRYLDMRPNIILKAPQNTRFINPAFLFEIIPQSEILLNLTTKDNAIVPTMKLVDIMAHPVELRTQRFLTILEQDKKFRKPTITVNLLVKHLTNIFSKEQYNLYSLTSVEFYQDILDVPDELRPKNIPAVYKTFINALESIIRYISKCTTEQLLSDHLLTIPRNVVIGEKLGKAKTSKSTANPAIAVVKSLVKTYAKAIDLDPTTSKYKHDYRNLIKKLYLPLVEIYVPIETAVLAKKPGAIRNATLRAATNFSAYVIISLIKGKHNIDDTHIPRVTALSMLEHLIIGKIMDKYNLSAHESLLLIRHNVLRPELSEIISWAFDQLEKDKLKIRSLRNPSQHIFAENLLTITKIKRDNISMSVSLSLTNTNLQNFDIDGDSLSFKLVQGVELENYKALTAGIGVTYAPHGCRMGFKLAQASASNISNGVNKQRERLRKLGYEPTIN